MMIKVVKDIRNQVNQVLRIKDQHRRNITSWMHITPNMVKKTWWYDILQGSSACFGCGQQGYLILDCSMKKDTQIRINEEKFKQKFQERVFILTR